MQLGDHARAVLDRRRLRDARIAAGLTQGEVATRVHVAQTTVYMWEHDLRTPRATRLPAIAAALGIAPDELTNNSGEKRVTLADVRQRAGYSQAALAARLALPPSTVSSIEQGRHRAGRSAKRWRQLLGLSAAEFDQLWQYNHNLYRARQAGSETGPGAVAKRTPGRRTTSSPSTRAPRPVR